MIPLIRHIRNDYRCLFYSTKLLKHLHLSLPLNNKGQKNKKLNILVILLILSDSFLIILFMNFSEHYKLKASQELF